MDETLLRQMIVDELEFEPRLDAAHIGVAVEKGVVTLTGHVANYHEKMMAEEAVRRVKGVKAIAQEIEVRFPSDKAVADDQIAQRAINILKWDVSVPSDHIAIKVENGWVTLSGTVDWQFQRQAAERSVRKLGGVRGVNNLINIKPGAQSDDVKKRIEEAFRRNAELEAGAIRVSVNGDRVTLEGRVKAWYERQLAEDAAWAAGGVGVVEDRLAVG